jgi:hypothetical protein
MSRSYTDEHAQAARSSDPKAARALVLLMRSISDECYCAGWMSGLEDALWDMLAGGSRRYGQGENGSSDGSVKPETVDALRLLHERCGGWWYWHDDADADTGAGGDASEWGPRFATTAEWVGRC